MLKKISPSVIAYLVLLVLIIILRLMLLLFPPGQIAPQMVNLTDNLSIAAIWGIGWVGEILGPRTGFTGMWVAEVRTSGVSYTRHWWGQGLASLPSFLTWLSRWGTRA
jgi:hypothetical protein